MQFKNVAEMEWWKRVYESVMRPRNYEDRGEEADRAVLDLRDRIPEEWNPSRFDVVRSALGMDRRGGLNNIPETAAEKERREKEWVETHSVAEALKKEADWQECFKNTGKKAPGSWDSSDES